LALSWQTLWVGPFLVEGQLGSPADVSEALPSMLQRSQVFWKARPSDFLADSASSSSEYLQSINGGGFTHWSVSYNKWTSVPERTAAALPETAWSPARTTRWRNGPEVTEQAAISKIWPKLPTGNALVVPISYPPHQLIWKTRQTEQFLAAHFIWLRIRGAEPKQLNTR
jgi:hypothetical protein